MAGKATIRFGEYCQALTPPDHGGHTIVINWYHGTCTVVQVEVQVKNLQSVWVVMVRHRPNRGPEKEGGQTGLCGIRRPSIHPS